MPDIHERATEYSVCALPDGHREYPHFVITVEYRGDGMWAVMHMRYCLGADGEWEYEPIPSGRTDEFLTAHRFDLATALQLARRAAPDVTCNGLRPADVLAWGKRNA